MEMRRSFKIIIVLMIISAILCSSVSTALAISDNALWEDAELCPFLEAGEESNSDLCFAAVKVKYDRSINRIYLLFTLEFNEFNNIESCGVIMNFNGMGNIKMMCDGTADYDSNVYFAELEDELHDVHSKNVLLEITVGIKSGVPENVIMNVNVIDTNGVKSNTYNVDITEDEEPIGYADEAAIMDSGERDAKVKTAKVRTTKIKTTKHKTTKHKTTKRKTTKPKKSRTGKATDNDSENEDEISQAVIDSGIGDEVEINNRRKKLMLALGVAATLVAVAAGCTAGIKNRKNDKDGGHE
jgi:hypothetical protein